MVETLRVLAERLAQFDTPLTFADRHSPVDPDIAHFLRIIGAITPAGNPRERLSPVSARAVDEIMDRSELIDRLKKKAPEVTVGPLLRADQYWISTGRPSYMAAPEGTLDQVHFIDATGAHVAPASAKPFDLGLYTSTGAFGTFGMWWCYLQLNAGSTLFPRPWTVWSLKAASDARVLEIATAADWAEFVSAHAIQDNGLVYPNWALVGERWDGVHMTVSAIAATQGICLSTGGGHVVAPPYWEVESTLWLRWMFTRVEPIESLDVGVG